MVLLAISLTGLHFRGGLCSSSKVKLKLIEECLRVMIHGHVFVIAASNLEDNLAGKIVRNYHWNEVSKAIIQQNRSCIPLDLIISIRISKSLIILFLHIVSETNP